MFIPALRLPISHSLCSLVSNLGAFGPRDRSAPRFIIRATAQDKWMNGLTSVLCGESGADLYDLLFRASVVQGLRGEIGAGRPCRTTAAIDDLDCMERFGIL